MDSHHYNQVFVTDCLLFFLFLFYLPPAYTALLYISGGVNSIDFFSLIKLHSLLREQ